MTRKDFQLLASALNSSKPEEDPDAMLQWGKDCFAIAKALASSFPRFDIDHFLDACAPCPPPSH